MPVDPVNLVIDGMKRLTERDCASIMLQARQALQSILSGEGTLAAWRTVSGTLKVATVVDRMYFSEQYAPELAQAARAHSECAKRAYGYSGLELQDVKFAFDLHMEHLNRLTFRELNAAVDLAAKTKKPTS